MLALCFFALVNVAACWLCRQPETEIRRIVRKICWLLLGGNLLRYLVVYPPFYQVEKITAEFSPVA